MKLPASGCEWFALSLLPFKIFVPAGRLLFELYSVGARRDDSAFDWATQSISFDMWIHRGFVRLWLVDVAIFGTHMRTRSNHPAPGKAGFGSSLAIGHQWPGLPEPGRWAASI